MWNKTILLRIKQRIKFNNSQIRNYAFEKLREKKVVLLHKRKEVIRKPKKSCERPLTHKKKTFKK